MIDAKAFAKQYFAMYRQWFMYDSSMTTAWRDATIYRCHVTCIKRCLIPWRMPIF